LTIAGRRLDGDERVDDGYDMSFGESENDVPELLFLALNPNPNPALHLTRR